ncbi:universal stress protein [Algoriphagus aestuarii]|nr:universal stress protein [Algoriphagus aestuarii]
MKILVPLDFSDNSKKALDFAVSLVIKKSGEITILHVIEAVYDFAAQAAIVIEGMHRDAESYFQNLINSYEHTGIKFEWIIKDGTVSIMTSNTAKEINADLIVIGAHDPEGLDFSFVGRTSTDIIKSVDRPVLLVPGNVQIKNIEKVALALEFSDHEEPFIEWIIHMAKVWDLRLEFLHIVLKEHFNEKLMMLGLEAYVQKKSPELDTKLEIVHSNNLMKGLDDYLSNNENVILVMCHHHKNFWEEILTKSKRIQMANHTHVPLLIMN